MSGHNKWSQIRRQKEKTDGAKSRIFSRFAKLITDEARKSDGNVSASGLKTAIERARAANMPTDNIERAIKKATGAEAKPMETLLYEAYGPGGTAFLIEVLTDSRNRAAQEVKHVLAENSGNLAGRGAAMWAFSKSSEGYTAQTTVPVSEKDLAALEKLVDALEALEDVQAVHTNAE
ncbi:MAG TPA: YebC/PmpR family DNA-binding transcriptional regulator [Candidatus Paceibacterota bacterium]